MLCPCGLPRLDLDVALVLAADLDHEVGEVPGEFGIGHHLPFRRKQFHVALDIEELLTDQHQFARQCHVVGIGQGGQLTADIGIRHIAQAGHGQRCRERLEVLGGLRFGFSGADRAHQHQDFAGRRVILLDQQCVDEFAQQPPSARIDASHDAEVQEHDPALAVDQEVAGVQVAVEQAVPQAALEGAEQQCLDQFGAVETLLADRGDVVDPHSLDAFHGQHTLTGEVQVWQFAANAIPQGELNPTNSDMYALDTAEVIMVVASVAPSSVSSLYASINVQIDSAFTDASITREAVLRLAMLGVNVVLVREVPGEPAVETIVQYNDDPVRAEVESYTSIFGPLTPKRVSQQVEGIDARIVLGTNFRDFIAGQPSGGGITTTTSIAVDESEQTS